jgi:hypothetical protein
VLLLCLKSLLRQRRVQPGKGTPPELIQRVPNLMNQAYAFFCRWHVLAAVLPPAEPVLCCRSPEWLISLANKQGEAHHCPG